MKNFSGRKNELEDVDALIKQLESFTNSNTKELPFWKRDFGEDDQEKAIYRLVKIGLVKDYEKNWGSKIFTIFTNDSALRPAPPISAPSMLSIANSSLMLSTLTLPP